jgi:hypothetical protein
MRQPIALVRLDVRVVPPPTRSRRLTIRDLCPGGSRRARGVPGVVALQDWPAHPVISWSGGDPSHAKTTEVASAAGSRAAAWEPLRFSFEFSPQPAWLRPGEPEMPSPETGAAHPSVRLR